MNENKIIKNEIFNKDFFYILNEKILKRKSLYFELFVNSKEIGYLNGDVIEWKTLNNTNEEMKTFLKSGEFAISNRTFDFIDIIFKNTCNSDTSNNLLAYVISSLYLLEYNIDNVMNIYIAILLYNNNLLLNIDNNQVEENILNIIQKNILTNFPIIKDKFISIKNNIKNISIPKLPKIDTIFNGKPIKSKLEKNNFYYDNDKTSVKDNIDIKKKYIDEIETKLKLNMKDINSSLKSLNIKKEYLEEIIKTYKCHHDIETLNLINEFNPVIEY